MRSKLSIDLRKVGDGGGQNNYRCYISNNNSIYNELMRLDLNDRLQIMSTRAQHFTASEIYFLLYILDATMFRQNKHIPRGFITCV